MPEPRSAPRAPDAAAVTEPRGGTCRALARRRRRSAAPPLFVATCCCCLRHDGPSRTRGSGRGASARAGRACSSSSTRSRRPAWSAAERCATASAGRATSTTSPTRPRTSSRPTTTAWPLGCWRPSGRSAARRWSTTCSRSAGARTSERVRQRLAERLPADAPLADRARELAVIQDEQGYLAEARHRRRRRHPPGRAQLRHPPHRRRRTRPPARPSWTCSARSSAPTCERETHIASGDRCCTYRIRGSARSTAS